jgi:hypothetical protein
MRLHEGDILEIEAAGTLSDTARSKTSSWAVRCTSVKGSTYGGSIGNPLSGAWNHTNECDIVARVCGQAWTVREATERGNTREYRVRLRRMSIAVHAHFSSFRGVPVYRRHLAEHCTRDLHAVQAMALANRGRHGQQQLLQSRELWKKPSFSLQFEL